MPRPATWYLRKIDLFAELTDEEMMETLEGMTHCEFPNKHVIFDESHNPEDTYVLKEGEVTLYRHIGGKKVVIDILKPGAIFGNIGFESDAEGVSAEVSQKSFICSLPKNFFVILMNKRPDIALKAFKLLSKRISQYQSQLTFLSGLDASGRILTTIRLVNMKDNQSILPELLRMPTKLTHDKLAGMSGLTRETVTKNLQVLQDKGFVSVKGKNISLTPAGEKEVAHISDR